MRTATTMPVLRGKSPMQAKGRLDWFRARLFAVGLEAVFFFAVRSEIALTIWLSANHSSSLPRLADRSQA